MSKSKANQYEAVGNQNYLNFIKKNHQLLQNQFKIDKVKKNINHMEDDVIEEKTNNASIKVRESLERKDEESSDNRVKYFKDYKSNHKSEQKIQLSGVNYNRLNQIYQFGQFNSISYDVDCNQNDFQIALEKNKEVAFSLKEKIRNKNQLAKEMLFHLNKNKTEHKKLQFKGIPIHERYGSLQNQEVQFNLKFPEIKKNSVEQQLSDDHGLRQKFGELSERKRIIKEHQGRKKIEIDSIDYERAKEEVNKVYKTEKKMDKFKMREELYNLLPAFKGPFLVHDKKSKPLIKIEKIKFEKLKPTKEFFQPNLQSNTLLQSVSIEPLFKSQKEVVRIQKTIRIFNKEIIQSGAEIHEDQTLNQKEEGQCESGKDNEMKQENLQNKVKVIKQIVSLKYDPQLSIYDLKIRSYRQFLFMINLAHRKFDALHFKDINTFKNQNKYKFYLGKGNNSLLIKSLLKRRFWWIIEEDQKKANFLWTQLKVNNFYQYETKAIKEQTFYKLDVLFQVPSPKKNRKIKPEQLAKVSKAGIYRAPLPPNDKKIFTNCDKKYYNEYLQKVENPERMLKFSNRLRLLPEGLLKPRRQDRNEQRIHNHLEYNYFIGNKKALFYNLKQYYDLLGKDVFKIIPLTYHIKNANKNDTQFEVFSKEFKRLQKEKNQKNDKKGKAKNVWIVKPGQLSNRGQGITVIDQVYELNNILKKKQKHFNGVQKTYIVQKYIEKPLLYKCRKFDIRHYMLISRLHGQMRAYWFSEGYIRTSSQEFNIDDIGDQMIHLTNDAIQKYSEGYGKYEEGNKVSYNQFQRYMDALLGENKFNFSDIIYPKMKSIALDAVKSTYLQIDPNNCQHNFEIFGLDFMIDSHYDVWLIEVNTNPCLELSSKLLARIIPTMLEHAFRLTLDVIFPPPTHYPNSLKYLAPDNPLERLQFQLIFDEERDGKEIVELYLNAKKVDMGTVDQDDEIYQNDGKEIELDNQIQ